mgnify:CR=1 FL=1
MSSTNSTDAAGELSRADVQALLNDFDSLDPITPQEAVDQYISSRKSDLTSSTLEDYEDSLDYVVKYCEKEGIDNLNDFGGRQIFDYTEWRKHESSNKVHKLAKKTMRDELYTLSAFLRFLEKIDAVERGTAEKVDPPTLESGEGVRDVELEIDFLQDVTDYLTKYHYASREHVVISIIEETGRRLGGVHSLDLCDTHLDGSNPFLEFRHHGDGNSRLKNGEKSEQQVNISKQLADLIRDYLKNQRIDKEVDGRKPLLTTSHGRLAKGTIRTYFYKWTRACKVGKTCPENRNPENCNAACSKDAASKCPTSEAPHAAKHGYLTEMRRREVPKEVLSERCDVSEEIIEEVYDERSVEEKRDYRREVLEDALGKEGDL